MEVKNGLEILKYMIFEKQKFVYAERMRALYEFIPAFLLAKNFNEKMQRVLFIRSRITACRWRKYFDTCFKQMLSSHEMYLTFAMFACFREDECHQNKFESLLSVCSLVKFLSDETLQKTGVNFLNLNPDIFTVFYRYRLQQIIGRRGGLRRLVEYIHDHKYLKWTWNWRGPDDPTMDSSVWSEDSTQIELDQKLEKELKRERVVEKETNPDVAAMDATSIDLAKMVLSITPAKLPSLPSELDLMKSVIAYRRKKMAKNSEGNRRTEVAENLEAMDEDLKALSSSNSDSKTDCAVKHQENIKRHENIIEAVIRHNNSKSSNNINMNSRIQEETEVLEHLKDKIKSLIEVLDEYDKE